MMQFRELKVGQRFDFAKTARSGMEPGPWVKASIRKYRRHTTPFGTREQTQEHREWNGLENSVASIHVEVVTT